MTVKRCDLGQCCKNLFYKSPSLLQHKQLNSFWKRSFQLIAEHCKWSPSIKCLQIQGTADSRESQTKAVFLSTKITPKQRPAPTDTVTFCYFYPFALKHPVLLQVASLAVSSHKFPSPKHIHNRISIHKHSVPVSACKSPSILKKKKYYQKTISVSSFTSERTVIILTHQASLDKIYHTVNGSLLKASLFRAQCLLFWNEQGEARRAIGAGCGSVAGGRMLGACVCQAKTDGELTLCIALGAEMWMMTGAHVALNPALSLQAEQWQGCVCKLSQPRLPSADSFYSTFHTKFQMTEE